MDLLQLPRKVLRLEYQALRLPLTVIETATRRGGPSGPDTKQEQARQVAYDGAVGRAKELVGTVLRNDRLVSQGQVQRAKADELREAMTREAVAEQRRAQADEEFRQRQAEVQEERAEVARAAARRKAELDQERSREKQEVDAEVDRREAAVRNQASRKRALVDKAQENVLQDRSAKVQEANRQEQEAEEARRTAAKLNEARDSA